MRVYKFCVHRLITINVYVVIVYCSCSTPTYYSTPIINFARLLLELDEVFSQLVGDMELLTRFHRVWEDLSVWATDTKSVLDVASTPSTSSSPNCNTSFLCSAEGQATGDDFI